MKKIFLSYFFLIFTNLIFSQQNDSRLEELLSGYLANDLDLQNKTLLAQSKALALDSTEISNGIAIELSSGNMTITTDTSNNSKITVSPSVSIGIPQANGAKTEVSIPLTIEDGKKTVSNGSANASIDLISSTSKQRKVNLLQAQRSYIEAKRDVQDRAISAEKEFYVYLKKLFNYAIEIRSKKSDLFDDEISLKVLETQGYSKTSAKYRTAFLKVESDKREVKESQHLLERETAIFAMKCGMEYNRDSSDPTDFLPKEIPQVQTERIFDYDSFAYTKTESALWNKFIGDLKREIQKDLSLSATAEYKFNSTASNQDDVGGKLTLGYKGLAFSGGAYIPTGNNVFENSKTSIKNDNPYFQFSLSLKPNEWRLANINEKQEQIDSELENIAIKSAQDAYDEDVLSKVSSLHDIKWSQSSNNQEYEMYTQLEADMAKWLKEGIVTESDYLDALNNKEKAYFNSLINAIDLIVFNNEVKLMFHDDNDASFKINGEKND